MELQALARTDARIIQPLPHKRGEMERKLAITLDAKIRKGTHASEPKESKQENGVAQDRAAVVEIFHSYLDFDNDSKVSVSEFHKLASELFGRVDAQKMAEKMDADGDGVISKEELLRDLIAGQGILRAIFEKALALSGDGKSPATAKADNTENVGERLRDVFRWTGKEISRDLDLSIVRAAFEPLQFRGPGAILNRTA